MPSVVKKTKASTHKYSHSNKKYNEGKRFMGLDEDKTKAQKKMKKSNIKNIINWKLSNQYEINDLSGPIAQ